MLSVIYHKTSGQTVKFFDTLRGAKCSLTRLRRKVAAMGPKKQGEYRSYEETEVANFVVDTNKNYRASEVCAYNQEMVTVYNNITGDGKMPIKIRRCEVGGPCDPSTERYHCS